jgi:hypothetical protein
MDAAQTTGTCPNRPEPGYMLCVECRQRALERVRDMGGVDRLKPWSGVTRQSQMGIYRWGISR